jgi:hypothetical protein
MLSSSKASLTEIINGKNGKIVIGAATCAVLSVVGLFAYRRNYFNLTTRGYETIPGATAVNDDARAGGDILTTALGEGPVEASAKGARAKGSIDTGAFSQNAPEKITEMVLNRHRPK